MTRYRRHADLRLSRLDDDGVALHLGERTYVTVNGTGATVLEALDEPRTLDELVTAVVAVYDVTPEVARETVATFLRECEAAKLVVPDA